MNKQKIFYIFLTIVTLICISISSSYAAYNNTAPLPAQYWSYDDANVSGINYLNTINSTVNQIGNNTPTTGISGLVGQAIYLNKSQSEYATFNNSAQCLNDNFTVSFAYKLSTFPTGDYYVLAKANGVSWSGSQYAIVVSKNGYLQISLASGSLHPYVETTNISLRPDNITYGTVNKWITAAITKVNGGTGANTTIFYLNGTAVFNTTLNVGTLNCASGSSISTVGTFGGFLGNYFNGTIDELAIWNYELTPAQVQAVHNNMANGQRADNITTITNNNPVVAITSPPNDTISGIQRNVSFIVTDDSSPELNCSLYINNILNQTIISVVNNTATYFTPLWIKGAHQYYVSCFDGTNTANSGIYTFTFNSSHSIILFTPTNGTRSNILENVQFEVYDSDNTTTSCSLFVDSVLNQTNSSVVNDTVTDFVVDWVQGTHSWYVVCNDGLSTDTSPLMTFDYDTTSPFININSPSYLNSTIFSSYTMNLKGNVTDNNLWRVNRTIRYPNGTIYYTNFSGDLPALTTIYSWDDTFDTTTIPNGIYTMFIEAADSHTSEYFADALDVDINRREKKLTYTLPFDTVTVEMTGGDLAEAVSDVQTDKLDDRYTFEYSFDRDIESGDTAVYHVTSTEPIIYLSDSGYKAHFILAQKYWMDFENYNGDVAVEKITDYDYEVVVTVVDTSEFVVDSSKSQLDSGEQTMKKSGTESTALKFNSLGGLNEANITIIFSINNCIPDWRCDGYGSCNISDLSPCDSATDLNTCGLAYSGDYGEFSAQSCNYCSASFIILNQTACLNSSRYTCARDNNFASCCNVTHIGSDCPLNASLVCGFGSCVMPFGYQSEYSADDISNAGFDFVGTIILFIAGFGGLIAILLLMIGFFKYVRKKR